MSRSNKTEATAGRLNDAKVAGVVPENKVKPYSVARQCLIAAKGDRQRAADMLRQKMVIDPLLRDAVLEPYEVRAAALSERTAIIISNEDRTDGIAMMAAENARSFFDWPLSCNKLLGDAVREDIEAEAALYRMQARAEKVRAIWMDKIAAVLPKRKTVRQALNDPNARCRMRKAKVMRADGTRATMNSISALSSKARTNMPATDSLACIDFHSHIASEAGTKSKKNGTAAIRDAHDIQRRDDAAAPIPLKAGPKSKATMEPRLAVDTGPAPSMPETTICGMNSNVRVSPSGTLFLIREIHRQHQDLLRAEVRLELQIQAIHRRSTKRQATGTPMKSSIALSPAVRPEGNQSAREAQPPFISLGSPIGDGGDNHDRSELHEVAKNTAVADFATLPLQEAQAVIHREQMKLRKRLEKLAKCLPIYERFVENISGFGPFGLAQIVGECGDLSSYPTPAKLWKRMGLHVHNGAAAKRISGAEAIEVGYSPQRRAIMFVIGESLLKKKNAYYTLYLKRKEYEEAQTQAGAHAERVASTRWSVATKENKERIAKGWLPKSIIHKRAARYATKRLLLDLWKAWRGCHPRTDDHVMNAPAALTIGITTETSKS